MLSLFGYKVGGKISVSGSKVVMCRKMDSTRHVRAVTPALLQNQTRDDLGKALYASVSAVAPEVLAR